MEPQQVLTMSTISMTNAKPQIRREETDRFPGLEQFAVIHRYPILSYSDSHRNTKNEFQSAQESKQSKKLLPNKLCDFAFHPKSQKPKKGEVETKTSEFVSKNSKRKPTVKRSVSSDHMGTGVNTLATNKQDQPSTSNRKSRDPPVIVATAHWQDSPLCDDQNMVCTKLSLTQRNLLLRSKPRKYLHLAGGAFHVNPTPTPPKQRRLDLTCPVQPAMTTNSSRNEGGPGTSFNRINPVVNFLPPPPPLIRLNTINSFGNKKMKTQETSSFLNDISLQRQSMEFSKLRQIQSIIQPNQESRNYLSSHRHVAQRPASPLNLTVTNRELDQFYSKNIGQNFLYRPTTEGPLDPANLTRKPNPPMAFNFMAEKMSVPVATRFFPFVSNSYTNGFDKTAFFQGRQYEGHINNA